MDLRVLVIGWAAVAGLAGNARAQVARGPETPPPTDAAGWDAARLAKQADDARIAEAAKGVADYRKIAYASSDGLQVPAYLFRPLAPPAGRLRAVVYVHGSQHGQFTSRVFPRVAEFVRRGYVVLAPDYRSSAGYTQAFYDAADYGGREIDDLVAARDWLAAQPDVDPTRIALVGQSHGGYNALMALALHADTFAAGVDFFGPTDLVWRLTAPAGENPNAEPGDREYFARMVGKDIGAAPELYRARSPRYLADRIRAPLLILHGDKDAVVSIRESEWMVEALEKAGNRHYVWHVMKGGAHGYPAAPMDEGWQLAYDFLDRALR
jgi:dipeptidyl aminopeptidase/acylaminoacyl peptidase